MLAALLLIFGCLLAGVLLQRLPTFPASAYKGLNAFLIYFSLPAITLRYLPEISLSFDLILPVAMAWIVFIGSWGLFDLIGKRKGWSSETIGCLVLVAGLGNTSFIGFPMIKSLYGEEGLSMAVLCDQPGSFLVLSTIGILSMGYYLSGKWAWKAIGREMFRFPPFLAFLLAIPMMVLSIRFPSWIQQPLEIIGGTLTPIAMVSIGLQLQNPFRSFSHWQALGTGLLVKLLLAPALIATLYFWILQSTGMAAKVSVLEAAMAPMVTPSIIAMEKNLNPRLASMLIAVGIPIGIATVLGWYWLIEIG